MVDLTGYKLTFDDEFNNRSISSNGATTWHDARDEWRMPDGKAETGFGSSSFMDPSSGYDPFSVKDGALTITAAPPGTTSAGVPGSWQSGLITTQDSFSQKYGYFEMRAEVSNSPGGWDGYWMLPTQQSPAQGNTGSWQELDTVEHLGSNPSAVYSFDHTTASPQGYGQVITDQNTAGYHTYGVKWTPEKLDFYFDGQLTGSQDTPADYQNPMYMVADLAIKDGTVAVSQNMKIDYIRAYSNDPNAVAVAQGTVSAPDGHDPGLYGATAATAGAPSATQPATGSSTGTTNSTTGSATASRGSTSATHATTSGSTDASDTTTPTASTTGSTTGTTSMSSSSPAATTGATSPASGSTDVTGTASGLTTGSVSTTGPFSGSTNATAVATSTAGSTTPVGSTAAVNGMANTAAASSAGSTSTVSGASSAQGTSTSSSGTLVHSSTSNVGDTTQTAVSGPMNIAGPPSTSPSSIAAASGAGSSNITSRSGNNYAFQTYVASPAARAAALSAEKKIIKFATNHPEQVGMANKMLEMLMHFW